MVVVNENDILAIIGGLAWLVPIIIATIRDFRMGSETHLKAHLQTTLTDKENDE